MSNKGRSIIVGIVISALLLIFLFWGLDWDVLVVHFSNIRLLPVLAIVLLFWISLYIRAIRWRYLLPNRFTHSTLSLYNSVALGFFASTVLPLRAGEVIRPWLYCKRHPGLSFAATFASIVIERVFDTVIILILFAWILATKEDLPPFLLLGAYSLGLLALVLVVVTMIAYVKPAAVLWFVRKTAVVVTWQKAAGFFKVVETGLAEFLSGLRAIASGKELFFSIFWTVILWLEISIIYQLGMYAMGEVAGIEIGIALCVVIALAVAAPSAPGFIGTFQLGCGLALTTLYGFDQEFAMSYSIVMHALQFIATLVFGLFALQSEGLRFSQLVRSKE